MSNMTLTFVQEVFFDLCDAIEKGDLYDYPIQGFEEFKTVIEFLEEQKRKMAIIEELITDEVQP